MGLSSFFASRLSRPAGKVLDAPIRDIVQEVLRESGYASPGEVEQLRDQARDLRGRLDALDKRLGELVKVAEGARAEASAAAQKAAATPGPDPRVAELESRLVALAAELQSARSTAAAAPAPAAEPLSAAPRGGCKVPGCKESVRSKGFCSPHYQQWRRGTLKGFVNMDGTAMVDGRAVSVPSEYAGGMVTVRDGKVLVDGRVV
ncbi:MAG: hypothetical protein ACOZNI_32315 [Myxococcota bacterium]